MNKLKLMFLGCQLFCVCFCVWWIYCERFKGTEMTWADPILKAVVLLKLSTYWRFYVGRIFNFVWTTYCRSFSTIHNSNNNTGETGISCHTFYSRMNCSQSAQLKVLCSNVYPFHSYNLFKHQVINHQIHSDTLWQPTPSHVWLSL